MLFQLRVDVVVVVVFLLFETKCILDIHLVIPLLMIVYRVLLNRVYQFTKHWDLTNKFIVSFFCHKTIVWKSSWKTTKIVANQVGFQEAYMLPGLSTFSKHDQETICFHVRHSWAKNTVKLIVGSDLFR